MVKESSRGRISKSRKNRRNDIRAKIFYEKTKGPDGEARTCITNGKSKIILDRRGIHFTSQKIRMRGSRGRDKMQQEKIIESLKQVDFSDLRVPMIVVYKNPKDYPDAYVARVWEGARNLTTNILTKKGTLPELRKDIKKAGFTTRISRSRGDDPVIVETWIR